MTTYYKVTVNNKNVFTGTLIELCEDIQNFTYKGKYCYLPNAGDHTIEHRIENSVSITDIRISIEYELPTT